MIPFLNSCHVGRYFYWNTADVRDLEKFPADTISIMPPAFRFHKKETINPELPESFLRNAAHHKLSEYLAAHKTHAFLIIQNDSIIYEEYFGEYHAECIHPGFSVSKAFVSALTGIALKEGYIQNLDQKVIDFIPEMKHPGFDKVRIKDLLNMRSGIKFNEGYFNPFGAVARFYYGRNLMKYTLNLKITHSADSVYHYASANTQLLAFIIERATGKRMSAYLEEKIWVPLGMEQKATWNIDSKKHRHIKAFCCINATARDFAKLGRLYINKGSWEGQQIIPEEYVRESWSVMNDSRDSGNYPYTYQWRVSEKGFRFAKGILGQYVYADPSKNLIAVRLGKSNNHIDWPLFIYELTSNL